MDTAGIRMQVLSVPGPGAEIVSDPDGIAIAKPAPDSATWWTAGVVGSGAVNSIV